MGISVREASPSAMKGFTLLELMVVVVVIAIIAAIALPGFGNVMRSNRVATTSNEMLASLAYARSEAIRNTRGAAVCASADGATCVAGGDWSAGWIVWPDLNADGTLDAATETVLRFSHGNPQVGITGPAGAIRFDARGRLHENLAAPWTLNIFPDTCPSGQQLRRAVVISSTGQTTLNQGACP